MSRIRVLDAGRSGLRDRNDIQKATALTFAIN
jgi:hypothetical protein